MIKNDKNKITYGNNLITCISSKENEIWKKTFSEYNKLLEKMGKIDITKYSQNMKNKFYTLKNQLNHITFPTINFMCDEKYIINTKENNYSAQYDLNDKLRVVKNKRETSYITFPTNADINIFLEFVYKDIGDVPNGYKTIHLKTLGIIKDIFYFINDAKINEHIDIKSAVVRVKVEPNGEIIDTITCRFINDSLVGANVKDFKTINVPETKKPFKYDEFLNFKHNEKQFSLQVEHSENMEKHKSNLVEAVLRFNNTGDNECSDATDKKIIDILKYFGYETNTDNKYSTDEDKYSPIKTSSPIYLAYPEFWLKHNNKK